MKAYVEAMTNEWEDMVPHQDSQAIVNTYTEDTIFIKRGENETIVAKHVGRNGELTLSAA